MAQKTCSSIDTITDVKNITVPISSFPPTAMVYSVTKLPTAEKCSIEAENNPQLEMISAGIMARVLEDREKDRIFGKHCGTCSCSKIVYKSDTETQTEGSFQLANQKPLVINCVESNNLRINEQDKILTLNSERENNRLNRNETKDNNCEERAKFDGQSVISNDRNKRNR